MPKSPPRSVPGDQAENTDGSPSFSGPTATSATAGATGDVPAQTAGYLLVTVAGVQKKIPYYNV